jgi:hypothetical protein
VCALKRWKDLLIQNLDLDRTTDKFLDDDDGRVLKQRYHLRISYRD